MSLRSMSLRSAFVLVSLLGGCFDVSPGDGVLVCNPSGKSCPDGYVCNSGRCVHAGSNPVVDLAVSTDGLSTVVDLASPYDLTGITIKGIGDTCHIGAECSSGFCADGYCCTTACDGQCEACDIGGLQGTCTTLSSGGQPHNTRAACTNNGTAPCGGRCDGTSNACSYPPASTICGASCDGLCDGAGTCASTGGSCPGGYACGSGGCKTSCSAAADCQLHFTCNGTSCVRDPESDCFDGVDNNGDGKADCDDPTCTAISQCETDPGAGTIGNLTSAACAANFGAAQPVNKTLTDGACSGGSCFCNPQVTCNANAYLYSSSGCGGATTSRVLPPPTGGIGSGPCVTVPTGFYAGSITLFSGSPVSASCTSGGSSALPTPSWGTSSNFCPVVKKGHCSTAGKVCVPKVSTGSVCVQLPTGTASCPNGYTSAAPATWYGGYTKGTCSCGCTNTSASCGGVAEIQYFSDSSCGSFFAYNTGNGCETGSDCCTDVYYGGTKQWNSSQIGSMRSYFGNGSGSCSNQTNLTASSTPTSPSVICCQ